MQPAGPTGPTICMGGCCHRQPVLQMRRGDPEQGSPRLIGGWPTLQHERQLAA